MFILTLYLYLSKLVKLPSKQWRWLEENERNPIKVGHEGGPLHVFHISYLIPERIRIFQRTLKIKQFINIFKISIFIDLQKY